jgi:hypothetical protein
VIPVYITIPICLALACAIAFGVLGLFALIDIHLINRPKGPEK